MIEHQEIGSNPRPKNSQINKNLSCCHWNVNSLLALKFSKVTQIDTYKSSSSHDFASISETYFDSSVLEADRSFQLCRYNTFGADHPCNTKQGGVCIYYKEAQCLCEVKLSNLN